MGVRVVNRERGLLTLSFPKARSVLLSFLFINPKLLGKQERKLKALSLRILH